MKASASTIFHHGFMVTRMTLALGEALLILLHIGTGPMTRYLLGLGGKSEHEIARTMVKRRIIGISFKEQLYAAMGRPALDVHCVKRLTGAMNRRLRLVRRSSVGAHFRQQDHADALAAWREDVDAIVSRAASRPTQILPSLSARIQLGRALAGVILEMYWRPPLQLCCPPS